MTESQDYGERNAIITKEILGHGCESVQDMIPSLYSVALHNDYMQRSH